LKLELKLDQKQKMELDQKQKLELDQKQKIRMDQLAAYIGQRDTSSRTTCSLRIEGSVERATYR
jgi:hypothetical protein